MIVNKVEVNGLEIAYQTFGEGEPLVLIMGIGAQMVFWPDDFCTALAHRGFRVVRFDHRDTGLSGKLNGVPIPSIPRAIAKGLLGFKVTAPYDLRDMAGDVAGLIEILGFGSAHLFGVSMGGMIAQVLATEFPERVRTLTSMMSTTGARRYLGKPRAIRGLFMPAPRTREEAAENMVRFFTLVGTDRYPLDEADLRQRAGLAYDRCHYPKGFARQLLAIISSGNRTRALATVRAPTLVIHGREDPLIPVSAGRATARAIPGAKLHIIDDLGHVFPRAIWPEVIDLIVGHTGSGRGAPSPEAGDAQLPAARENA